MAQREVSGETNQGFTRRKLLKELVLLWSSPIPLVPVSALRFLSKECLDPLFHLRQVQGWQVLHLNLQACVCKQLWSPSAWQVFPAFSKRVWRRISLFNTFMFLTSTAIMTPVFFTSWAKTLKILITGKINHTHFCFEMWTTLWSYIESYKLPLKSLPIPSSWDFTDKSVNISVEKNLSEKLQRNCAGTIHLRLLFLFSVTSSEASN